MQLLEAFAHADDVFDLGADAKDEELDVLIRDCTSTAPHAQDGQGINLLQARLTEKKSAKPGFDPTVIITIITTIISMISQCKKPTPASLRRKFGNRAALAWQLYAASN